MTTEHPQSTRDDEIAATVDGNALRLIESGEERLRSIIALIDGAEKDLRLLFYLFADDDRGRKVRDALVAAARRGVEVKLLLDGFGCGDTDPDFFADIRENGGDYCVFHPRYGRRYLVRNHQKLAIADGKRALIGGSNLQENYLSDGREKCWRDLWLSIEGPTVKSAVDYFESIFKWTTTPRSKLKRLRQLVHDHSQFRGIFQWKFTAPLSLRNPWPSSVARDVANARKVDVLAAYFSPPRSMIRRLAKLGRKRQVRVITAAKSDNHATIGAARYTYSRLLRGGVDVYEYQPTRLHTKLVIADDVVHIGSANFDFRSFYINLELVLRIRDQGFADQMRGYFEREMADSVQITPDVHRKRATLWRRFRWTVSHFLVTSMDYTVTRRLNFSADS